MTANFRNAGIIVLAKLDNNMKENKSAVVLITDCNQYILFKRLPKRQWRNISLRLK